GGAHLRLRQCVPYGVAMELALTCDPIDAQRALEIGLVGKLADAGGALDAAIELAQRVAVNAPLAFVATKQVLQVQRDWSQEEFWGKQGELTGPVFTSNDTREGSVAFAEKRDPVSTGP